MLVKNTKCQICGANKVTENKSMYIYCDYCGSWMGYDMDSAGREAMNVFAPGNMSNPDVKQLLALGQQSSEAAKALDKHKYIEIKLQGHELDFKLFPERFGPKGKQSSFRRKYLEYYKVMYEEIVNEEYFEKINNPVRIDSNNLKISVDNGVVKYEFDDAFFKFIDDNISVLKSGFEDSKSYKCLEKHPEYEAVRNSDLMYKISISSMIQSFPPDAGEQIIKYLGMTNDFIDIPDVNLTERVCVVCNSRLSVPAGSNNVVCETCGCKNEINTSNISCPNCAANFDPKADPTCPFCNSKVEKPKSMSDALQEKYMEVTKPKETKMKGFFGKLFG
jgi:hypothetical protein